VFSRKVVRSCKAPLVSPELSAVFSWFSRFVKGFVDCEPEGLPVVEFDPEVEEEDEVEDPSALISASTFASAALAPFTSFEPNDLSRAARSVARGPLADVLAVLVVLLSGVAPGTGPVAVGVKGLFKFATLLILASSLKRELGESDEIPGRLMYFPFELAFCGRSAVALLIVSAGMRTT
jgi:hypothetical protein